MVAAAAREGCRSSGLRAGLSSAGSAALCGRGGPAALVQRPAGLPLRCLAPRPHQPAPALPRPHRPCAVEFYFSDSNLPTDDFMLKQIRSNPDGYGEAGGAGVPVAAVSWGGVRAGVLLVVVVLMWHEQHSFV